MGEASNWGLESLQHEGLETKTGQTDELIWLREGPFQVEQHVRRPQNERRSGWGHLGLSLREESGQCYLVSSSDPVRVQAARRDVWSEKTFLMECRVTKGEEGENPAKEKDITKRWKRENKVLKRT